MFEEEAKKHKEHFVSVALNLGVNLNTAETIGTQKEESFREGAEFGFNKANGWHYVDKEGLPEDKYKVLVQNVNGDYDIAFNFAGTWRGSSGNELRGAYAWKEIFPPKESE